MKRIHILAGLILIALISAEAWFMPSVKKTGAILTSSAAMPPTQPLLANSAAQVSSSPPPRSLSPIASPLSVATGVRQPLSRPSASNSGSSDITSTHHVPYFPLAFATCRIGNKKYPLQANGMNCFPQIDIDARQKIALSVQYPGGIAGQKVNIQVADGGGLGNDYQMAIQESLDANGGLSFDFQAGSEEGIYRVIIDNNGLTQTFRFWVGLEPPLRGLTAAK